MFLLKQNSFEYFGNILCLVFQRIEILRLFRLLNFQLFCSNYVFILNFSSSLFFVFLYFCLFSHFGFFVKSETFKLKEL